MKPILLAGILSVFSLNIFAADYQCSVTIKEDIKVVALEVEGQGDHDYSQIDPALIVNQEVLNAEYFSGDLTGLTYTAYGIENGNTKILYTTHVELYKNKFSFSDDLSKAFQNQNKGFEHQYSLQVLKDNVPSKLGFVEFGIKHIDKVTYPNSASFTLFGHFAYDSNTQLYSASMNLSRLTNIMKGGYYSSTAKVYFSPGQDLVYLENHMGTGYHNFEDYQDTNMGSGKSDDLSLKCQKM
ncbi:MAG: hypothetical protein VX642_01700 [Bdellovibrionota bacterium]|nr:hypothetical protein [Bdellovibrionota bacterium]